MEYKGFKVGDKVAISDIHGTVCNISESLDKYHIRTERNGVILVGANEMKKLPNYAVGDVVRAGLKILDVTEFNAIENVYYFGNGEPRLPESALRPFDGFKIGDTLWTEKRGKGKIVGTTSALYGRPYFVRFENECCDRTPKLSNLIPTEAKYKAAMTGGFQVDIAFVLPYNSKCDHLNAVGEILGYKLFQMPPLDETEIEGCKSWADILKASDLGKIKIHPGNIWKCPPCPDNPYFGKIQVAGCDVPKTLAWYTDCQAEPETLYTHMILIEGGVCKYKSKFGMHQLVSYAGCVRAVVDKIHFKDGKFIYDLRTNDVPNGLPEYSLSAVEDKFKVGDAVFYKGKKWEVISAKQRTDNPLLRPHIKYDINRQVTPNGCVGACVNESDLRLWKDTKFTQILATQNNGGYGIFNAAHKTPNAYLSFSYLGKMWDGQDVFHCINKEGYSSILFGEKGDDC